MAEPIVEFKDEAQAYECLKEWQTRLFLDDWTIKLAVVPQCEMILENCAGENEFQIDSKCCVIRLAQLTDDIKSRIVKVVHEKELVHELLHCKYNWIKPEETLESKHYDVSEHALLEQTAKSLIMAKYNLPFEWFKNF